MQPGRRLLFNTKDVSSPKNAVVILVNDTGVWPLSLVQLVVSLNDHELSGGEENTIRRRRDKRVEPVRRWHKTISPRRRMRGLRGDSSFEKKYFFGRLPS